MRRQGLRMILALALVGLIGVSVASLAGFIVHTSGESLMGRRHAADAAEKRHVLETALKRFEQAARWEPWNPEHRAAQGEATQELALLERDSPEQSHKRFQEAARFYEDAIRLHPLRGEYQLFYGWMTALAGDQLEGRRAIETALRLYPQRPAIWYLATEWYLAQWETLQEHDRQRARELLATGVQSDPRRYIDLCWDTLEDPQVIRRMLPENTEVQEAWHRSVTERLYIGERWAEQARHAALVDEGSQESVQVLRAGWVPEDHHMVRDAPPQTLTWQGLENGWLSATLRAKTEVELPPGEALLIVPMRGEPADGIWPDIRVTLGDRVVGWTVDEPETRASYFLVDSPGGFFSVQALITNGRVLYRNGEFIERRVALYPAKLYTPDMVRMARAESQ